MPGRAEDGAAVAVVIPAYEAADTIPGVVSGVLRALPGVRVYVVDDGSRDTTGGKAGGEGRGRGGTLLAPPPNLGEGGPRRRRPRPPAGGRRPGGGERCDARWRARCQRVRSEQDYAST